MNKYIKTILLVLIVAVIFTGCKKVPKLEDGKEAVVSLDKGGIPVDDLYNELKDQYGLSILIDMIDTKILDEKYESTSEEKDYIKEQKSNESMMYELLYKSQYSSYNSYLRARYGIKSEDELDSVFKLSYRRTQATKDYAKTLITDSEIEDYYKDDFIADIEASHILITAEYEAGATTDEIAAAEEKALETAKEVIKKLDEGQDFAELAKEYSKDGSAEDGGALGRFGHGDMVSEFETAAYALKVNEYTKEPVKTQYGYHIILKTKEYDKDPLEDVKDEIIDTLVTDKINNTENFSTKALINLREEAGMTIEDSELSNQYENYIYQY